MGTRRRLGFKAAALAALAAAVLLASVVVLRVRASRGREALFLDQLDRAIVEHRERLSRGDIWAPRVLRGAPVDGNGIDLQRAAIASSRLPEDPLAPTRDRCFEPKPDAAAWLAQNPQFEGSLRRAANAKAAWIAVEPSQLEDSLAIGRELLVAQKLLLVQAQLRTPDECLAIAADGVRLGQQLTPGAGLLGFLLSVSNQRQAIAAMLGCAPGASSEALAQAAREALLLAEDAPSFGAGDTLESEHLFMASRLRAVEPLQSFPRNMEEWDAYTKNNALMATWPKLFDDLAEARAIGSAGYPDAATRWRALAEHMASQDSRFPSVVDVDRYIRQDRVNLARLRALAMLFAALAADANGASAPLPQLTDPFSGLPLKLARTPGKPPVVWSVGPDGFDDLAAGDDLAFVAPAMRGFCPQSLPGD